MIKVHYLRATLLLFITQLFVLISITQTFTVNEFNDDVISTNSDTGITSDTFVLPQNVVAISGNFLKSTIFRIQELLPEN